jgi:CRP-like cAMP-binding protein
LLKAFYITENGQEFIKSFIQSGDVIASLPSYELGLPSPFAVACIEDSILIEVSFDKFKSLIRQSPQFALEVIKMLTHILIKKEQREYEFLCLGAEKRFELLRSSYPGLLDRIKQQDIARYLGVTPVALSRISAQAKSRKS